MSTTHTARPTSVRGLLAGLLALVAFSSAAVAMTAHGTTAGASGPAAAPGPAPAVATAQVVDGPPGGDHHHDHGR